MSEDPGCVRIDVIGKSSGSSPASKRAHVAPAFVDRKMCPGVPGVIELNPEKDTYTTSGLVALTAMPLTKRPGSGDLVTLVQVVPPFAVVDTLPLYAPV